MIRRRATCNALEASPEPRWLVSRSMYGRVLGARRLEPGADLVRAFLVAVIELLDAGWQVGEFSSAAALVRYRRGTEQRLLTIEELDPRHCAR
ncbi:MAG TPA: hypothetical protein VMD56_05735 [Steroidobacteraceae bacterium]|nr:hypothetical protein [Steroidobacteraceae bacterium]